jgi:hypothetical protein
VPNTIRPPGLIVLPTPSREEQQQLLGGALTYIEQQAKLSACADAGEFMINRVIEISQAGVCAHFPLPENK